MTLFVNDKDIVIPGELLAEGEYVASFGTYKEQDKVHSSYFGLLGMEDRNIRVIPLSGRYVPKIEDKIIGQVIDIMMSGWRIDTNSAYSAVLNVKDATTRFIRKDQDLSQILDIGDYIYVRITNVTSQNLVDVTMKEPGLRKLSGGRTIKINPSKVPRVIGKKGSMVMMIKEKTNADVVVGLNGLVWIRGEKFDDELKAEKAIKLVEEKAHMEGLTQEVEKFLNA